MGASPIEPATAAPIEPATAAPASAPIAAHPGSKLEPATHSRSGWAYPETRGDRSSRALGKLLRGALAGCGVLALVLLLLWGIPTLVVVRSAPWAVARAKAEESAQLRSLIGEPLRASRLPGRWRLVEDGGEFQFQVSGPGGRAQVAVVVSAGHAVKMDVFPIDW